MNLEDRHLKERPGTRTNTPLSLQSRHIPKPAAGHRPPLGTHPVAVPATRWVTKGGTPSL